MKPVNIRIHPLALAAILAVGIPAIAIAAGTVLTQPVSTSGSNTGAVFTATNTGTGPAIRGVGQNGHGIVGVTTHNSTSISNGTAGVIGTDNSASGTNNNGVNGFSSRGIGVAGGSSSGTGVRGVSTNGAGVVGTSTSSFAVIANAGTGTAITANNDSATSPALIVQGRGAAPVVVANNGAFDVMSLDNMGNMVLYGSLTEFSTPLIVTRSVSGQSVGAYAATSAEPTIEDLGEGQLVRGEAFVALDPSFSRTIDQTRPYLVFLTPQGNSHGLYVTQKSLRGFTVRENDNGGSTITFDFRIVATPFNRYPSRLPIIHRRSVD